jgi:hypothetical protein
MRIDRKGLKLAKTRAASFVRKFNPSGYDEEILPVPIDGIDDNRLAIAIGPATGDTPATLYGRWWHDFIRRISWNDESSWKQIFEEHQSESPATKRSADEWELFLHCLKNDPGFSERLTSAELLAHPEMPFLWRMDDSRCLEGVVDLALLNPNANKVLIVDWKTNRIALDEIDDLRVRYRPQMAAYWEAVTQMTRASVDAGIYSTSTGQFAAYEHDELSSEWGRLRNLPQGGLAEEISPN